MLKELLEISLQGRIRIDTQTKRWLEDIVLMHLKCSSLNELRDRFEGQAFLNRFLITSYAELAVQKVLKTEFISNEEKEKVKGYQPKIIHKGNKISIIASDYNSYPLIPKEQFDFAIITFVNINSREVLIAGGISSSELEKLINKSCLSPAFSPLYSGHLMRFDKLLSLEEIPEFE